ncbi:DUF5681 domain-containing protein [Brevundimonas nasdae]|uniref:DUF5681 domain-containing protein n=1 Tax=Brevundimonas nasdae TaxID=172043 RepID=UPI000689936B|nr:DUF5681 domain-containing protein [Brevundimonas nasdae]
MAAEDEDKVGYGRPPKKNQFKKGQSGNPTGRPKKAPVIADLLDRQLSKEVTVNGPDGPTKMTVMEMMIAANAKKAVRGDTRAANSLIQMAERHGVGAKMVESEVDVEAEMMLADMIALMSRGASNRERDDG